MIAKCPCQSCGVNIEFDAEAVSTLVTCPACGERTRLSLPPVKPAEPKENFIQREAALWTATTKLASATSSRPAIPAEASIEDNLDILATWFFWGGVISAALAGVALLQFIINEQPGKGLLITIMVGAIVQGLVARVLFQAAAEVIRLLRKITQKK